MCSTLKIWKKVVKICHCVVLLMKFCLFQVSNILALRMSSVQLQVWPEKSLWHVFIKPRSLDFFFGIWWYPTEWCI